MPPTTKPASKSASKNSAKASAKAEPKSTSKAARESKAEAKVEKAEAKPAAKTTAAAAPKPTAKAEPAKKAAADERPAAPAAAKEEPMTLPRIPAAPAAAPAEERPSVTSTMPKAQLEKFRRLLEEKRDDIVKKAKETLEEDMTLDTNDLPDEMDLASSEYLQSFTFRLRGREKSFLDKINKALERIDGGTFGVCEECGDEISVKRLEARPETTLCIRCKEDQERAEKDYG